MLRGYVIQKLKTSKVKKKKKNLKAKRRKMLARMEISKHNGDVTTEHTQ